MERVIYINGPFTAEQSDLLVAQGWRLRQGCLSVRQPIEVATMVVPYDGHHEARQAAQMALRLLGRPGQA